MHQIPPPVISWTTAPENISGLVFRMEVDGDYHRMAVKDDGVYLSPAGLIIIFY